MKSATALRISFVDFWRGFDAEDNFLLEALRREAECQVVSPQDNPDVLFYSCFAPQAHYTQPGPIRIYFTGENDVPDFNECDYAISFHPIDFCGRHLRLPLYCTYQQEFEGLASGKRLQAEAPFERPFCSVVISNANPGPGADPTRLAIFEALNAYKPLASGGRYANNVGGPVLDKIDFIRRYKFNLAVENSSVPYYTTEKLLEPLYAGTVPIYWGNPAAAEEFDPSTYINLMDFDSLEDAVAHIAKVDADRDLYMSYFKHDPLAGNPFLDWRESLSRFLKQAVERGKQTVSYGRMRKLYNRHALGAPIVQNPLAARAFTALKGADWEPRI